jgi:hypothetical protein
MEEDEVSLSSLSTNYTDQSNGQNCTGEIIGEIPQEGIRILGRDGNIVAHMIERVAISWANKV